MMRWPWQRASDPSPAEGPAVPRPAGWAFLPPLQGEITQPPRTLDQSFLTRLPTRSQPQQMGTMGHLVLGGAPAGTIAATTAQLAPSVQRAVSADLTLRPPTWRVDVERPGIAAHSSDDAARTGTPGMPTSGAGSSPAGSAPSGTTQRQPDSGPRDVDAAPVEAQEMDAATLGGAIEPIAPTVTPSDAGTQLAKVTTTRAEALPLADRPTPTSSVPPQPVQRRSDPMGDVRPGARPPATPSPRDAVSSSAAPRRLGLGAPISTPQRVAHGVAPSSLQRTEAASLPIREDAQSVANAGPTSPAESLPGVPTAASTRTEGAGDELHARAKEDVPVRGIVDGSADLRADRLSSTGASVPAVVRNTQELPVQRGAIVAAAHTPAPSTLASDRGRGTKQLDGIADSGSSVAEHDVIAPDGILVVAAHEHEHRAETVPAPMAPLISQRTLQPLLVAPVQRGGVPAPVPRATVMVDGVSPAPASRGDPTPSRPTAAHPAGPALSGARSAASSPGRRTGGWLQRLIRPETAVHDAASVLTAPDSYTRTDTRGSGGDRPSTADTPSSVLPGIAASRSASRAASHTVQATPAPSATSRTLRPDALPVALTVSRLAEASVHPTPEPQGAAMPSSPTSPDATVQRAVPDPGAVEEPRSEPPDGGAMRASGSAAAPAAGVSSGSPTGVEALAAQLYGPLVRRLKTELLLERERRGLRIDGI